MDLNTLFFMTFFVPKTCFFHVPRHFSFLKTPNLSFNCLVQRKGVCLYTSWSMCTCSFLCLILELSSGTRWHYWTLIRDMDVAKLQVRGTHRYLFVRLTIVNVYLASNTNQYSHIPSALAQSALSGGKRYSSRLLQVPCFSWSQSLLRHVGP